MADLVTFGETMLRFSPPDEARLEIADQYDVDVAGAESNVAVAAQRLGLDATWLSKLPDSPIGRKVANELRGHGVSVDALADVSFPDHERIGRTLCRPAVVDAVDERIEVGQSLSAVESVLDDYGVDDTASMLARLGYRIEWTGLDGGTVAER